MFKLYIKDIRKILADKKILVMLIMMPIVISSILGFALKGSFGSNGTDATIQIAIVKNYDLEEETASYLEYMHNKYKVDLTKEDVNNFSLEVIFFEHFMDAISVIEYEVVDESKAKDLLGQGEISAIVRLPKDFVYSGYVNLSSNSRLENTIQVEPYEDSRYFAKVVIDIMKNFSDEFNNRILAKNVTNDTLVKYEGYEGLSRAQEINESVEALLEQKDVRIVEESLQGYKVIDSFTYVTIGILGMFMLFSAGLGGRTLKDELREKSHQRLLVAGLDHKHIFGAKYLLMVSIAMLQVIIMLVYSHFALGVQWYNWPQILVISLLTATTVASLGLLFAFVVLIQDSYVLIAVFENVIIQVMALFGGGYIPIYLLPNYFQSISQFTINGLFVDATLKLVAGANLVDVSRHIISLFIISILLLSICWLLIRKRGEQVRC